MNKYILQNAALFLCLGLFAIAPLVRSQQPTSQVPQPVATPGKEHLQAEEPEANTSASTEALQKATQNPVASLISVPVQNNSNFGVNPG